MRRVLLIALAATILAFAPGPGHAMPLAPAPGASPPLLPISGGCGPYGHRGFFGRCRLNIIRPYGPYGYNRPFRFYRPFVFIHRPFFGFRP